MPTTPASAHIAAPASLIDSPQAAWRLLTTLGLVVLGNSSMYVVSVVLPAVQAEFGVGRADASLPYTLMMVCLGLGGLWTGRMADRHGLMPVLCVGAVAVCGGFVWAGLSGSIWIFGLAHGLMGLVGSSATFAPLMADTALWWNRQHGIEAIGWRQTYVLMGLVCGAGMLLLALRMRQRAPMVLMDVAASAVPASSSPSAEGAALGASASPATASAPLVPLALDRSRPFGLRPVHAQLLLCVAGVACCVAMAMPQVHIVAYCTDLGFGAARGAEMLSLMLACGIVSRLVSGVICDRIGGVRPLLVGSALQGVGLMLFLPFDGLVPLYVISAMFGLFQGGIVPAYAIIIREYFAPQEAGARVGAVIMATLIGMALGGWMSGWIFDVTGSYQAAFINGMGWNLLNLSIMGWLYWRGRGPGGGGGRGGAPGGIEGTPAPQL